MNVDFMSADRHPVRLRCCVTMMLEDQNACIQAGNSYAVTAVPEPQTWALMLGGALMLALRMLERRAS